jgi:hypothetical protein
MMQYTAKFTLWGLCLAISTLGTLAPLPCAALGDFWQPLTGPYGGNVRDLVRQSDGDLFVTLAALPYYGPGTLGYSIPIYRSRNGGYSWEPLQQGAQYLAALANGDVYALYGAGVSRSRDDGDTWTPLSQAPGNGTALVATAGGTLLLATSDAGLYRSENDGLDWQPSGFPGQRIGALVADADSSVHLGVDKNLYESTDDGVHWNPVATVPAAITALAHGADGLWWIGTRFIFFPPAGGVFAYDGIDEPSIAISATNVTDLAVRADGTVFAATAGYPDMEWGEVLRSNGPGQPWVHTGLGGDITALVLGDHDGVYAGVTYSYGHIGIYPGEGVWFTSGPATQWISRNRGLVHATAHAITVAPGGVYAQAGSRLARSTDRGLNWEVADGWFDIVGLQLAAHSSGDVFLTSLPWVFEQSKSGTDATTFDALVMRSRDRGATWQFLNGAYGSPIVVTAAGSVLSPGYGSVARSTDRGDSWNYPSAGLPNIQLDVLQPGPTARVFGATAQETFVSDDDGQSWSLVGPVGGTQLAVSPDEQSVYVLAQSGPVHQLTEIAPGTWSDTTLPLGPYGPLAVDARGTLYMASDTVYRLASGDAQWSAIPDTPGLSIDDGLYAPGRESIVFDEAGFLYVGTGNLGVLRSREPVGSIASDTGRQPTITAWYAGANPNRGRTAFALELKRDARVSLALYDVRGRVVSTLWSGATLGAGRHVASWRPDSQVASGTYFYRLDVGGALRSGRVTLVR